MADVSPMRSTLPSASSPQTAMTASTDRSSVSELSPARPFNMTGATMHSEILLARGTCRTADLVVERADRVHDEHEHALRDAGLDADNFATADEYLAQLEDALEELESIEIEEVPAAAGFADKTILAEVAATRNTLSAATARCKSEIARCTELLRVGDAQQSSAVYYVEPPEAETIDPDTDFTLAAQMAAILRRPDAAEAGLPPEMALD